MWLQPTSPFRSPEIIQQAIKLIDEKSEFLQQIVDNNLRVFFTHDPILSVAHINQKEGRYQVSDAIKQLKEEYSTC